MDIDNDTRNIDELLTVSEIAEYLKVSERTIQRMIKAGDLPSAKISGQLRFVKAIIDDWILAKMTTVKKSNLVDVIDTAKKVHSLVELIPVNHIVLNLKSGSVGDILRQLVSVLEQTGEIKNSEDFIRTLIQREEMMSTAVENGIALPHPRTPEKTGIDKNLVVIGICPEGTDFNSLNGAKSYIFALLAACDTTSHLRLMAKISYFLRTEGTVEAMKAASSENEILTLIKNSHKNLSIEL
ncbi:MAG: PTS sugar transporter subunit IIA [Deltaproteobacteria bacterium]|nr:PTS sugar transporter subunit IIA [Deltaproteobacteria bacterium]